MKKKYSVIIAFIIWGCHNGNSSSNATTTTSTDTAKHAQVNAKPIEKGMTDTVFCTSDPSQKYAVYVPANYTPTKKWPIIYFFDPHGAGNFPLTLYKELADRYGFILAGTYGSKNGQQWTVTEKAAQAFMQDSWQRLSIDNNRMYAFGFSGGARVACSVALYDGGIAGVAACGGGFPERNPNIRQAFAFIGFVGDKDFNYTEMNQLNKQLDGSQLPHQLIVYHGKHQWPPLNEAEQAFQWFDVSAMKLHFIPKNDSLLKAMEQNFVKEADKAKKQNNSIGEYFVYKQMLNYLSGLVDVTKYANIAKALEESDKVAQYIENEQESEQQEIQVQNQFINYLSDKETDWWVGTVKEMKEFIKKDSLAPVALQNQRLLSYLSLACYMGSNQAFKSGNDMATKHFLDIYGVVDPSNPDRSYLSACLYAKENNTDKAMSSLNEAVKFGFSDIQHLQNDANFAALRDTPAFKELIEKIKTMPPKVDMAQ